MSELLQAARLWERVSGRTGVKYMSGRLGGVKVVILPNRDHVEDDPANSHTHTLFFQDGSSTQPRPTEPRPTEPRPAERAPAEQRERSRPVNRQPKQQIEDDPIPF